MKRINETKCGLRIHGPERTAGRARQTAQQDVQLANVFKNINTHEFIVRIVWHDKVILT